MLKISTNHLSTKTLNQLSNNPTALKKYDLEVFVHEYENSVTGWTIRNNNKNIATTNLNHDLRTFFIYAERQNENTIDFDIMNPMNPDLRKYN